MSASRRTSKTGKRFPWPGGHSSRDAASVLPLVSPIAGMLTCDGWDQEDEKALLRWEDEGGARADCPNR